MFFLLCLCVRSFLRIYTSCSLCQRARVCVCVSLCMSSVSNRFDSTVKTNRLTWVKRINWRENYTILIFLLCLLILFCIVKYGSLEYKCYNNYFKQQLLSFSVVKMSKMPWWIVENTDMILGYKKFSLHRIDSQYWLPFLVFTFCEVNSRFVFLGQY